jgi:phage shock protein A
MALITRVSRLFKADFHAVLDQIEEPEQLLKQAIRDMEDELAQTEQSIVVREQEQQRLQMRRRNVRESVGEIDSQLDLCFGSGKHELARGLIRRKLEAARLLKRIEAALESNNQHLEQQKRAAEEHRGILEGMRQKAEVFASRPVANGRGERVDDSALLSREVSVSDDEVEIAFLHEQSLRNAS